MNITADPDSDPGIQPSAGAPAGWVARIRHFFTLPATGIVLSLWAYLWTLGMAALAPRYLTGVMRDLVILLPLLTTLLVVSIMYWVYRANDEYIQRRILKCTAATGIFLAFASVGYFCLERLGYPQLSMIVVNLSGWSIFTILMLCVLYRRR
jgi:hypothetical protein